MPDAKDNTKLTGDTHPPEVREAADRPPGRARPPESAPDAAGEGASGEATDVGAAQDKDAPGARKGKP